jgi:hypothetical protein
MKEYRWLHYIGYEFFIASNPLIRHVCLFVAINDEIDYQELLSLWGVFKSTPLLLQIMQISLVMAITKVIAGNMIICNGNLVLAITKIIVGNKIPTENHLISSVHLFGLNPKQNRSRKLL